MRLRVAPVSKQLPSKLVLFEFSSKYYFSVFSTMWLVLVMLLFLFELCGSAGVAVKIKEDNYLLGYASMLVM